jgi:predicted ribosome quality control (RQC) complex YloA/Tae2 family protein
MNSPPLATPAFAQDAFIHAEVHGAATVILRSPTDDPVAVRALLPLLKLSLEQAGAFCVCLSAAWAAHTTTSAWWVYADQVSREDSSNTLKQRSP